MPEKKRAGGVQKKKERSVAYRMVFVGEANLFGHRTAEVTSPLLDPALHPSGILRVTFADVSDDTRAGRLVLDSFQMDSLADYLTRQAGVRRELQDALDEHLAEWDRKKTLGRGEGVWKHIKVAKVSLGTRPATMTPAEVAEAQAELKKEMAKLPKQRLNYLLAWLSRPAPDTKFTVVLDADWPDREHSRLAEFENGRLEEFQVE